MYHLLVPCFMLSISQRESLLENCLDLYGQTLDSGFLRLKEDFDPLVEKWTELEWQALWYSGAFGTTFRSTDSALVEIVQLGFWNREAGPDFVHAAIRIDSGQIHEGDIEWDMHVADWERHGHSLVKS